MIGGVVVCTFVMSVLSLGEGAHDWNYEEREIAASLRLRKPSHLIYHGNENRHDKDAMLLGKDLFYDSDINKRKGLSCSSCHVPSANYRDLNRITQQVRGEGSLVAPSLVGAYRFQWQGWTGDADSMWARALLALEDEFEYGLSRHETVSYVCDNYVELASRLLRTCTSIEPSEKDVLDDFVRVGKSLDAFLSTIDFVESRMDAYIDALISGDATEMAANLTESEAKGFKVFIKQGCANCHGGESLSYGHFFSIGTHQGGEGGDRLYALSRMGESELTCKLTGTESCEHLAFINRKDPLMSGAYKTPSIRNIAYSNGFMHDGRYASLEEVVSHYENPDYFKVNSNVDIAPLRLRGYEKKYLIDFLNVFKEVD